LGDEGLGVHAIRYLLTQPVPPNVEMIDGGTLSFTLAGPIAQAARLIVIDAAELGAAPGTVRDFVGEDMDRFLRSGRRRSAHEVSLDDLLAIARLSGDLPTWRALIAVQPHLIGWSERLSPEVERALPAIGRAVRGLLERWGEG
jgi:hydrogenase maturation protease